MYIILFIIEFFVLFFLSRSLTKSLSGFFYKITKSERITVNLLFCLFFFGILIHELAHLLTAGLLLVQVGEMELVPKVTEDGVRLGSVSMARTDPIRRAIIGVAPVLAGLGLIFGMLFYLQNLAVENVLIYFFVGFLIFEIANTLFSSKKDLEGTIELSIVLIILTVALFLIKNDLAISFFNFFQTKEISNLFKTADIFLAIPILIDLFIVGLFRVVLKRS